MLPLVIPPGKQLMGQIAVCGCILKTFGQRIVLIGGAAEQHLGKVWRQHLGEIAHEEWKSGRSECARDQGPNQAQDVALNSFAPTRPVRVCLSSQIGVRHLHRLKFSSGSDLARPRRCVNYDT